MTALELLTVTVSVLALIISMALSVLVVRVVGLLRSLADAVEDFRNEAIPAARDLRLAADAAVDDVARIEALLEVSEAIGSRVDSASEATYRALTSPIIKGIAIASGTRRAAEKLRGS